MTRMWNKDSDSVETTVKIEFSDVDCDVASRFTELQLMWKLWI